MPKLPLFNREPIRPFFPYYGSKWNTARYYPPPEHQEVIEPFSGSAGYSLFYAVNAAVLVDSDPVVVQVWQYLLSARPEQILELPNMPHVGDSVDNYPLSPAEKALIGFWLNRGSAVPKKSRTAYSARTDRGQLNWSSRAKMRIASQLHRISGWSVHEADFSAVSNRVATWFIDPPYEVAGKHYRRRTVSYSDLGVWCRERSGQVMVCENYGATWLPFSPLGSYKSTRGRSHETWWHRDGGSL